MIIKFRNEKGLWGWMAGIESLSEVSREDPEDSVLNEYGVEYFDEYGDPDLGQAYCYHVKVRDQKPKLAIFYTNELYLTDDLTGSTIEVLVAPHGKAAKK
jgi:hypothetical protein